MKTRKRIVIAGLLMTAIAGTGVTAWAASLPTAASAPSPFVTDEVPAAEQAATLLAMKPPKRARPVIAIIGANDGTETTDFILPYAVLREADVSDVVTVAPEARPIQLMPALRVQPDSTTAVFDARYPDGADFVVVPALHRRDDPVVVAWIKSQSAKGATIFGICSGGKTVSAAGLLQGRAATGHWDDVTTLRKDNPTMRYTPNRRYVADHGVVTTTGVSASLPATLALVEAIAGHEKAASVAARLGVDNWLPRHNSAAFRLDQAAVSTAIGNKMAVFGQHSYGLPVAAKIDEVALAFTADAWSRTYRSKAFSVANSLAPVATLRGLTLLPDRADIKGLTMLAAPSPLRPATALSATLTAIQKRYGDATASFVALQLEYPWRP
jgi:putative intracellular protease/amidase